MFKKYVTASKLISFSVVLGFSLASTPAFAESTGWVTPTQIEKISQSMNKKDMMPVSIKCKGDSRSSSIRDSMLITMSFSPNPTRKRWRWIWGRDYGETKHKLEKSGWKQVSSSGFKRPATGLNIRCGVFHQK